MPHGSHTTFAMLSVVCAYILSWVSQATCHYVEITDTNWEDLGIDGEFGFGMASREGYFWIDSTLYRGCVYYTDTDRSRFFDATWKAAIAMASLSSVFGLASLICILFAGCFAFPRRYFIWLSRSCVLVAVFDALTLIALSSDLCKDAPSCKFSTGAGLAIAASVLWLIAAASVGKVPEAEQTEEEYIRGLVGADEPNLPPGTVQTTQTTYPDGRTETKTTTVGGDSAAAAATAAKTDSPADGAEEAEETGEKPGTEE